jgi:hypothetical protein
MIHRKNEKKTRHRIKGLRFLDGRILMRVLFNFEDKIQVVGFRFRWDAKKSEHSNVIITHNHFLKGSLSRKHKSYHKLY